MTAIAIKIAKSFLIKSMLDEEKRNRLVVILLIPFFILIFITSLIQYLLTTPMELIKLTFSDSAVLEYVLDLRYNHGFDQYVEIADFDPADTEMLPEGSLEGLIIKGSKLDVVYYNQADPRWANKPYGKNPANTIRNAGCGPSSLAIIVSTFTGKNYDPEYMANWCYNKGFYVEGVGSYHNLIPDGAKAFGLNVEYASKGEYQKVLNALSDGDKLVGIIVGPGTFTTYGHFFVLTGMTESGKITIADPGSRAFTNQVWDFSTIQADARADAGGGGPYWIISK